MSDPPASAAGAGAASGPLLEGRGILWRPAGRTVLGPLDLEVDTGESLVVLGPNGAGKTTLLRLLAGVLSPTAGELRFRGRAFTATPRRALARQIAYVPQLRPVRVPLSVQEVVLLGRYPHLGAFQLAPRGEDLAAVAEALRLVEIEHLRHRPLDELSGGERQSVYIAAALAQEAEVLVLDEPTTHLDPRHQRDVAALIPRLRAEAGRTVVTATHDLHFAALTATRVLALRDGAAIASGPPGELMRAETLETLFDTPFEVVRGGERPVTLLRLER